MRPRGLLKGNTGECLCKQVGSVVKCVDMAMVDLLVMKVKADEHNKSIGEWK